MLRDCAEVLLAPSLRGDPHSNHPANHHELPAQETDVSPYYSVNCAPANPICAQSCLPLLPTLAISVIVCAFSTEMSTCRAASPRLIWNSPVPASTSVLI